MKVAALGLSFVLGALVAGALMWRVDLLDARSQVQARIDKTDAELALLEQRRGDKRPPASPAPRPTATAGSIPAGDPIALLRQRHLQMPVDGVEPRQLHDTFNETRSGVRRHEALDIMAPRGTPARAVEDGRVAKLFKSVPGGLTVYLFDRSESFAYYYAHLDRYAPGLKEHQEVHRGDLIGYVGSTGNASEDAPHLHFAIFKLGPERQWWKGDPINPFPVFQ